MGEDDVTMLRLQSATFSGPDRVEAFRETLGRSLMQLDIEPLPGHPFELDFTVTGFSGFGIATGTISPTRNTHTASLIADDDIVLICPPDGHGSMHQLGRDVEIKSGEATFVTNGSPGTFFGHVPSRVFNLRLSRAVLASMAIDIDAALLTRVPVNSAALRLLLNYAKIVHDETAPTTADLRRAVSLHMHELAALVAGATRDAKHMAATRGVRAARLRAIKEDILRNLAQQNLSAETLAKRQGITPRYVNMLFEAEGMSLSEFVLTQRLAQAHRMLSDPRAAGRPISAIAYDIGFGDLSYFNRTFRRRYGMTPSDVRGAAKQPGR